MIVFGRRSRCCWVHCSVFAVDYLFLVFAPSIGWLFYRTYCGRGPWAPVFTTAGAYIADISTPEKPRAEFWRSWWRLSGWGFIIGPSIGGLLGDYGDRVPFMVAGSLTLLKLAVRLFHSSRIAEAGESTKV